MQRRQFLKFSSLAVGQSCLPKLNSIIETEWDSVLHGIRSRLNDWITGPVMISSLELIRAEGKIFVHVKANGHDQTGITVCNERMDNLYSLFNGLIKPYYLGKDAKDITHYAQAIFIDERNYKYGGMPFWNAAGSAEIAIWDLLGKIASKPVYAFLGISMKTEIPVYLSSLTRDTTAQEEVEKLQEQLAATGCKAIKIKVGGRMKNDEHYEARTQALIPLIRKSLTQDIVIYADANGSYNYTDGIRIGKLLENNGIDIFEEPCSYEDYSANRSVNKNLKKIKLAGGEQDTSMRRWNDICTQNVYDILQPDVYYNGGIIRSLEVAYLAKRYQKFVAPHSPKADPLFAPFSQLIRVIPNLYGFQEYPSGAKAQPTWYHPHINIKDGKLDLLNGAGLGIEYDYGIFKNSLRM